MKSPLAAFVLAFALIGAVQQTAGCAAFASLTTAVPLVSEIVSDGETIISMIETGVQAYYAAHPSASQVAILNALTRARAALVAGGQALAGVEHVTAGQEASAFADFAAAYADLLALVAPIGIAPASPTVDGGTRAIAMTMVLPTPLALRMHK